MEKSRYEEEQYCWLRIHRLFMRAMMALELHLGGVGKYVSQIWGQTVRSWEYGDLQVGAGPLPTYTTL